MLKGPQTLLGRYTPFFGVPARIIYEVVLFYLILCISTCEIKLSLSLSFEFVDYPNADPLHHQSILV